MTKKTINANPVSKAFNAPEFMNVGQAAAFLGLSESTIGAYTKTGEIPCRRVGRRYVFSREALRNWAACATVDAQ